MSALASFLLVLLQIAGLLLALVFALNFRRYLVLEHERGLLYRSGKYQRLLPPGRHWFHRWFHTVYKLDVRQRFVSIPGQEVLSSDDVSLKVSLAASYQIDDPYRAVSATTNYQEGLYLQLQLALRDLIGVTAIDDILAQRKQIADRLLELTKPQAAEIGLALLSVGMKDVMFPGELKTIFAQVVNARKEGLAALERARGESAALRNLANSARLLQENPALLQLRLLQALGASSGNTVVLRMPDGQGSELLPLNTAKTDDPQTE